jgi:two-component system, OmpR family, response regulator
MSILLVEDDAMLTQAISTGLRQTGWDVDCVGNAASAQATLVEHAYEAVLLDLGLPGGSGLALLEMLRARYDVTPVLIITARDKLSDRLRGLDGGADDYLVKPFSLEELYARLRAVVRRSQGRVSPVLTHRDVTIDPARRLVTQAGAQVVLSAHEYRTLLALLERKGWVLTRNQLEDAVYGNSSTIESNTIAVYIHQLRRKFGNDFIETVPGFGYRIGGAHP